MITNTVQMLKKFSVLEARFRILVFILLSNVKLVIFILIKVEAISSLLKHKMKYTFRKEQYSYFKKESFVKRYEIFLNHNSKLTSINF